MPTATESSTHPPLPPTTEEDRVSWLRLLRSRRVGPTTFHRLLTEHGSARAALEALPEIARAAGVQSYSPCPEGVAQAEIKAARATGARMICAGAPEYPAALYGISDAPPILWAMGDPGLMARPCVAVVGARNASSLGLRMARGLAAELTEAGIVVVSGLARGIDTAAHRAALSKGTLAVMAGGIEIMYPTENAGLGDEIGKQGLRVSEQAMGLVPQARHFPARNRIISGLASAVVVVEAAAKSGSLITARLALEQGREVMAVPGHPFDARASGCNMLIRDGAVLVRRAEDVIELLPAPTPPASPEPELALTHRPEPAPETRGLRETAALHSQILNRLGPSPMAEDQLIRDLSAPPATVTPALTDLEMAGRIRRHPGGLVSLEQ